LSQEKIKGRKEYLNFYQFFVGKIDIVQHFIGKFKVPFGRNKPETP
jgi:hypothetical protein